VTRDLLCVPITARGNKKIGAIEVMNKRKGTLTVADLILVDHLAHLASLAIENAILA
jgi:GAF domain-containing protein